MHACIVWTMYAFLVGTPQSNRAGLTCVGMGYDLTHVGLITLQGQSPWETSSLG
jgi:hypothetical protein